MYRSQYIGLLSNDQSCYILLTLVTSSTVRVVGQDAVEDEPKRKKKRNGKRNGKQSDKKMPSYIQ